MLTTGTHFRQASEALAHCYADLLEGRILTSEEHSAAVRVLRMATEILGTADPNSVFDWERIREYLCSRSESALESSVPPAIGSEAPMVQNADESLPLTVLRDGRPLATCFQDLKKGDVLSPSAMPRIVVGEDAHRSEDPDYSGWLFYDEQGNGYFPEDFVMKS